MAIRLFVSLDGDTTSNAINEWLANSLNSASLDAVRPLISKAVINAQIGQDLSSFAGITQVPVEAAPHVVANAASTDRGASLA